MPPEEEDDTLPLLDSEGQRKQKEFNKMKQNLLSKKTFLLWIHLKFFLERLAEADWEAPESVPEGAEEVHEEPKAKRDTIKHELELDMTDPAFLVWKIYRAKGKQRIEMGEFKGKFRVYEKSRKDIEKVNLVDLFKPTEYVVNYLEVLVGNIFRCVCM